jgi:hypothetical protein
MPGVKNLAACTAQVQEMNRQCAGVGQESYCSLEYHHCMPVLSHTITTRQVGVGHFAQYQNLSMASASGARP